ncbi:hypothetical protein H4R21_001250 [Coemansia helicoidea]|uniref:Uncharacterized protein n=1 Tax=Coemansia helicoidea TaxID=1286919 RepID=A0ACC1LCU8_9FUNG|nr:hypothetical protein H4R21_001250 [Coemansia helicoidea]
MRVQQKIAALLPNHTVLAAPYTSSGIESIYAAESTTASSDAKTRWFRLQGLNPEHSYELRISYAATTPSDFDITLYSVAELLTAHGVEPGGELGPQGETSAVVDMYAKVTALYAGYSHIAGMENVQVPFIIVLERRILGASVQVFKLVAVLVVVVALSLFVVTPRILAEVDKSLADGALPPKQD